MAEPKSFLEQRTGARYVDFDGFFIDATPTEQHSFDSVITTNPIEDGSLVADHVRLLPDKISYTCIVSDTPIGVIADLRPEGAVPSQDAYAKLKKIRVDKKPITIKDSLDVFENMMIKGLSIPRSAATANALEFTVSFEQLEFVSNVRTKVRVRLPRGKRKIKKGHKPSKKTGLGAAAAAGFGAGTKVNTYSGTPKKSLMTRAKSALGRFF